MNTAIKRPLFVLLACVLLIFPGCFASSGSMADQMLELGERYLSEGNYEKAASRFEMLVESEPDNRAGYLGLAEAYAKMGEIGKAVAVLEDCLARNEGDSYLLWLLAELEGASGWPDTKQFDPDWNAEEPPAPEAVEEQQLADMSPAPEDWEALYDNQLGNIAGNSAVTDMRAAFLDVDGNGILEMFVYFTTDSVEQEFSYTIQDGRVLQLDLPTYRSATYYKSPGLLVRDTSWNQVMEFTAYRLEGSRVTQETYLWQDRGGARPNQWLDDEALTEEEYETQLAELLDAGATPLPYSPVELFQYRGGEEIEHMADPSRYLAEGANDEYSPSIGLYSDGSFLMIANLYEGMGAISGTFYQEGDTVNCTVTNRNFKGFGGDDVNSFQLEFDGTGYRYTGEQIGTLMDGMMLYYTSGQPVSFKWSEGFEW